MRLPRTLLVGLGLLPAACLAAETPFTRFALGFETPTDPALQAPLGRLDEALRRRHAMAPGHTAVGLLDLNGPRLALLRPDQVEYAASVPKVAILLAWFEANRRPSALTPEVRHELALMIRASSNPLAAKFSRELGLERIQRTLVDHGLYDAARGGGIWMGKHYGEGGERRTDPVSGHTHAATVRQLLRFYLLLLQERLVSPEASRAMQAVFADPTVPAAVDRFVLGLAGRPRTILRKSGWWEDWRHDSAVVAGDGRNYILVALTHHPAGDDYLTALAEGVDELLEPPARR